MYHIIEFIAEHAGDLEISRKDRLERVKLYAGDRVRAQVRPYVLETDEGFVEMADLFFEDGTTTRAVPFSRFSFVN